VQVSSGGGWKWLLGYAAAIGVAAAGVSYYAYTRRNVDAHRPAPIAAVPERSSEPPPPEEPLPKIVPVAVVTGPIKSEDDLPGTPMPPPENAVGLRPNDPHADLYRHKVDTDRPDRRDRDHSTTIVKPAENRTEAASLLEQARSESTQMQWDKAHELYERVARGRHLRSQGLLGMANVAWQQNDVDAAIDYARKAVSSGGGESAKLMLGHAYLKKGLYDEAVMEYDEVLKKSPANREAQKAKREAERQKGRVK